MNKDSKYYQVHDFYSRLHNKDKFVGRRPITVRSSYEKKYIKFLDMNSSVLQWRSEDDPIKYFDPTRKKYRRYFVDFWVKIKQTNGEIKEFFVEVKPESKLHPPKKPKRITQGYKRMLQEYIVNQSKFEAAEKLCEYLRKTGRNIEFIKVTEKQLGIK